MTTKETEGNDDELRDVYTAEDVETTINTAERKVEEQETTHDDKKRFSPGAFDEPKTGSENTETDTSETEEHLSVTFMIDSLFGFIAIIFFDDAEDLQLTPKELAFYTALEKKCGVELFVNSPYFYFGLLAITYSGKVAILIKAKRTLKKLNEQSTEKNAA